MTGDSCDRCGNRPFELDDEGLTETPRLHRRRDKQLCLVCATLVDERGYDAVFSDQVTLGDATDP